MCQGRSEVWVVGVASKPGSSCAFDLFVSKKGRHKARVKNTQELLLDY